MTALPSLRVGDEVYPEIPPTDAEVVGVVLEGDREAFRLLVQRHQQRLYRHALRMAGNGDAATDLVQAAFVQAFTRLSSCRDPERFGAWVFRILVNRCRDYLKSPRRRTVPIDGEGAAVLRSTDNPAREVERAELRDQLDAALARLPPAQREAFLLKHMDGLSYEEMSELLNTAVPALKMRVHRARDALRTLLEEVI